MHVAAVDVDGGAYNHDVRVARVWDGKEWKWADDWVVRDGMLLRPGHAPTPASSWLEALRLDEQGRVVARTAEGRTLEVLRGDDGRFSGMRAGQATVTLTPTEATGPDGTTVSYTYTGTRIDAASSAAGRVVYGYAGAALRTVMWPDGAALRIEPEGTSGVGGRWRCTRTGENTTIEDGSAHRWTVSRDGEEVGITDPAGARMRTRWHNGRLLEWTDPDGRRADLRWEPSGKLAEVRQDGDVVAAFRWAEGGLAELRDRFGGAWRLTRSEQGTEDRLEPDGRSVRRELTAGLVRVWQRGAESATTMRDALGRPVALRIGSQGEVRMERDGSGELVRIFDAAGGVWQIQRNADGSPRSIVDAAGTRWELKVDGDDALLGVTQPDGQRWAVSRAEGRLAQLGVGALRWTWLRDSSGALSGVRDAEGRMTGFSHDTVGRVSSVRWADGTSLTVGRDALGRVRTMGSWRFSRDSAGRILEVRDADGALAGWSRDAAGRVTGFGMGDVSFDVTRDAAGRIASVRAGEESKERWRIDRDSGGRTSAVTTADDRTTSLLRDSAGLVTRLSDELGTTTLSRDLRGRVIRVAAGKTWIVSRDVVGHLVRVEVEGIGTTGADYEPDGALSMVRLADGTLVRRNTSMDAGELLATDKLGTSVGTASWTLDNTGRLLSLLAGGPSTFDRDPAGNLSAIAGPDGEWARDLGGLTTPDGGRVKLDAGGRPAELTLVSGGPWGLDPGTATYRWADDGRLGGLDGPSGGAVLVHDGLGRPAALTLGERAVPLLRDAFGRLRRVGDDVLTAFDALLAVGDAPRAPLGPEVTARPGSAVFSDSRGYPLLIPYAGVLRAWPGGWVRGVDAAEMGVGGRYALPGGVLVDLLRATDPISGRTTAPDRWPWCPPDSELRAAASPFAAPDAATPAFWDAAQFDAHAGWSDALAQLVGGGLLPGGDPEPGEAPGLPWLPPSFARSVPAPVAGLGGIGLNEDRAGALVLHAAISAEPLDTGRIIAAFLGLELAAEGVDVPGVEVPAPAFVLPTLAELPFRH